MQRPMQPDPMGTSPLSDRPTDPIDPKCRWESPRAEGVAEKGSRYGGIGVNKRPYIVQWHVVFDRYERAPCGRPTGFRQASLAKTVARNGTGE
jgi:hypothetical protein